MAIIKRVAAHQGVAFNLKRGSAVNIICGHVDDVMCIPREQTVGTYVIY